MVLCKYGPSSLGWAAIIPGFDPESVAHEPFFGKLMNLGRLWRGGVVVPGG